MDRINSLYLEDLTEQSDYRSTIVLIPLVVGLSFGTQKCGRNNELEVVVLRGLSYGRVPLYL